MCLRCSVLGGGGGGGGGGETVVRWFLVVLRKMYCDGFITDFKHANRFMISWDHKLFLSVRLDYCYLNRTISNHVYHLHANRIAQVILLCRRTILITST